MKRWTALVLLSLVLSAGKAMAQHSPDTTITETQKLVTPNLHIVDKPLTGSTSRERLTTTTVDTLMLHFCSDVVENPDNPYQVTRIVDIFTSYGVSAHYLIDREGTIHRFVPEERVAYHAGRGYLPWMPDRRNNLNEYSIGIEIMNIGSYRDMKLFMSKEKYEAFARKYPQHIGYTEAQYESLNNLIPSIRSRHPIPLDRKHIVGHEEYAGTGRRTDPGELFDWTRIGLPAEGFNTEEAEP